MLVIAMGLVLAVMRQLDQPATINRLDQLFGADEQTAFEFEPSGESPTVVEKDTDIDLSEVRDKTYFRPEERPAWFALLKQLQQSDEAQLAEETVGELTYAQLLKQPEVYRGRVVTLHGTVLREELQPLSDNPLGLTAYHRLWIQPRGGGQWPFVVYCLRLPNGFPRGETIHAAVRVRGIFFKNWSYAWEEGLGLAPVVLANQPSWQQPIPPVAREPLSWQAWATAIVAACILAIGVTWLVLAHTRRPAVRVTQDDEIRQRFSKLAEEDSA